MMCLHSGKRQHDKELHWVAMGMCTGAGTSSKVKHQSGVAHLALARPWLSMTPSLSGTQVERVRGAIS